MHTLVSAAVDADGSLVGAETDGVMLVGLCECIYRSLYTILLLAIVLTVDLVNHTVAQSVSCPDLIKQCCMVYHLDEYLLQSIQEEN